MSGGRTSLGKLWKRRLAVGLLAPGTFALRRLAVGMLSVPALTVAPQPVALLPVALLSAGVLTVAALTVAALTGCTSSSAVSPGTFADASTGQDSSSSADQPLTGPLQVVVLDRHVSLQWEEDEFQFHCLTITQTVPGKGKVDAVFCGKKSAQTSITIGDEPGKNGADYAWSAVKDLIRGPATWTLKGGSQWGVTPNPVSSGTMRLGPHFGGPCQNGTTTATGLVEWHAKGPVTANVTVKLGEAAQNQIAISTPEIWIDDVTAKGNGAKGGTLSFDYTFDTPGMYTVEVNNLGGGAILNCAVYVGADVPLVPVEVGGGGGLNAPPTEQQLATFRQKLLDLTNKERASVKLPPLQFEEVLHDIAQYHSDDMSAKGYFAHVGPAGDGPGERAQKFGYNGAIGENIASNQSIEGAHNGLYWSAAHRSNMLNPTWTKVGFGIAKAADSKNMLVTENFAP